MDIVYCLFGFRPCSDGSYVVKVRRDKYKQLAKSTLYYVYKYVYTYYNMEFTKFYPIAVIERYGSLLIGYTYIAKISFHYYRSDRRELYTSLVDSVSKVFGLPRISINEAGSSEIEVEVEGYGYVFRTLTRGWTVLAKNRIAKVLIDMRKFVRFRDIPKKYEVEQELDQLYQAVDSMVDEMHRIIYIIKKIAGDRDTSELGKYIYLADRARHFIRSIDLDPSVGVYLAQFENIEKLVNAMRRWQQKLSTALEELKQLYAYITLTT
jgi:hypothetical protein